MVDWLLCDEEEDEEEDEEDDEEPESEACEDCEDCEVPLYSLSFTAVPFFCTHSVTSELTLLPPPGPPPMPLPPIWR
jgi:hypothetical protein